ncbi:NAD-binding protein [Arsenophonus endosymbiont of Bemisia tabaci]|uniref:NAD-binding protein n=1 Tax=Arsenophonus endosymbiont of Bemisia tabaci TaxID=536059 RepID=UPI0015F3E6FE|nr:NAD-binding protein [Arsenophonus endosymbiont of Bemisia tabaci]CAA2931011.1 Glutathione-regulated potassium-efflux system protein KefC [Arsenophonus endosymbiont of Bemisia tabaci Q2]
MANKIRITVLEQNVSAIYTMRRYSYRVYYSDAQDLQLLRSTGSAKGSVIVIISDNPEEVMGIVHLYQANFPNLHIIARARGRFEAPQLRENSVTDFCREIFVSALEMGEKTLINLGIHPHQAHQAKQHFRQLDVKIYKENSPKAGEGEIGQATRIKEARREFEELFEFEIEITQERGQPKSWD